MPSAPRTRLAKRTVKLPSGAKVVHTTTVQAPELEWRVQAAAVRALRQLPEHGRRFTLAADMNAARRSPQQATKDKATGLTAGEPDLRVYLDRGRLYSLEFKGARGRLSPAQVERHALLRKLGFTVEVVKAATAEEGAERAVELVRGWLAVPVAANDNEPAKRAA